MAKTMTLKEKNLQLERENLALRAKIEEEPSMVNAVAALGGTVALEMKKIRKKGKSSANRIDVVEIHDHKNISLWRKDGKRLGPMYVENAIAALNKFADLGVYLSADRPTPEQIAAYKETPEYKAFQKKEILKRERKDKSRKGKSFERLVSIMEKTWGLKKEEISSILNPADVGKK